MKEKVIAYLHKMKAKKIEAKNKQNEKLRKEKLEKKISLHKAKTGDLINVEEL